MTWEPASDCAHADWEYPLTHYVDESGDFLFVRKHCKTCGALDIDHEWSAVGKDGIAKIMKAFAP